ncbi:MAG TPA: hypothetical protein VII52_14220 [Gemmatimonadaceae bacterium]
MMRHCLVYSGGFERNFPKLKSGATSFEGTDGSAHQLPAIPAEVDGVRVHYMEKAGKKFAAVRVQNAKNDVVLQHELLLDPARHMGHGHRFSPEPTIVDDEAMGTLLGDIMAKNPEQRTELAKIRSSFSVTGMGRK